jgi:superfamily II DNA/RNA helicase
MSTSSGVWSAKPAVHDLTFSLKMVWFLAPNVALCQQQYEVFKANLPGYGIQMLSGQDGVDHWAEPSIWDAVLYNIRIVMSTPQVLYDALAHGFVKMSQLALLIFDEGELTDTPNECLTDIESTPLLPEAPCTSYSDSFL